MDNLLEAYTKLKLKSGSIIIVTYHTSDGQTHIEEFQLVDIEDFSYIHVANDTTEKTIPFFDPNTIIESITFKGQKKPIYYNPHFNENSFTNYNEFKQIMEQTSINILYYLIQREKLIIKYFERKKRITYDELFFTEKQREEFEIFFDMLITELAEYADNHNLDSSLKYVCAGTTSIIYEIGDKIIKIGKPRRISTIPYCEYLLQPIINRTYEFDGYPIHVEVTQKVTALDLDYDDGYLIYPEDDLFEKIVQILKHNLYKIGLKCQDIHPGNVGILLRDNKIHFDEISFETGSEEVTSIQNNNNLKILPANSYVIIDLDNIEIDDIDKYSAYLSQLGYQEKCHRRKLTPNQ